LVRKLGKKNVLKVLRPSSLDNMLELSKLYPARNDPPEYLIDSNTPNSFGGTGQVGDREILQKISLRHFIMIAGELNPTNVSLAVKYIQPWGVDVASGVETSPGQKDPSKIRAFVNVAKLEPHRNFGEFGGQFVSEALMPALGELEEAHNSMCTREEYQTEYEYVKNPCRKAYSSYIRS